MAAIAITKTKPTEATKKNLAPRLPAPVTGGVRTPCKLCDTGISSDEEEQEEQRIILNLKEDISIIWKENQVLANKLKLMHEDERKVKAEEEMLIKSMNEEMEDFISQIPMGKLVKHAATQTDEFATFDEEITKVKNESLEKEKKLWKDKEVLLSQMLILQKKSTQTKKKAPNQVKRKFWGHSTLYWTAQASGRQFSPDAQANPKINKKKNQSKPKPYSIPFQPKPINLFVKKLFGKPPPKLPPAYATRSTTSAPTVVSQPVGCNSVNFGERPDLNDADSNILARELFADALERAIASNNNVHYNEDWNNNEVYEEPLGGKDEDFNHDPYNPAEPFANLEEAIDGSEQDACVTDTEWASHPYYDTPDDEHDEDHLDYHDGLADDANKWINDEDDEASASEKHDDLGSPETNHGDEEVNSPVHDDQEDEVAWEDHPYYDTSEEASDTEPDASEEDVAWEDSPYY